jgi:hypothetical protein
MNFRPVFAGRDGFLQRLARCLRIVIMDSPVSADTLAFIHFFSLLEKEQANAF